jgi:hypothetical protein
LTPKLDDEVKLSRQVERLRNENIKLRAVNRKLAQRGGGYDDFINHLKSVLDDDKAFVYKPKVFGIPTVVVDKCHEEIAAVAVSDLHLTENVRSEDANGINVYNTLISANRLWLHSQKIKSILARHMSIYTIKGIWSPLLGDLINGTIHPEMVATNDLSDEAAVVLAGRLMYMFYEELKSLGLPIEIDTIVGNHPRTTLKMPTKRQAHTNYDWLIYETLADRFVNDPQIKINVLTSQIGMRKIYGHNYVFEHGIDVQNGKEENLEDRIRALFDDPIYRKATGFSGASFDQIVIGNLHKPKFLERTIVNGSYTGQNELGMSWRLKPIKAQQLMWGVSKKHVRTWMYAIDLTEEVSQKATNPMSDYASWFLKKHSKA